MSDAHYSVVQTVGGGGRPLLDLRNNPQETQRFVEAQKAMYDFVSAFVEDSIFAKQFKLKVSFILRAHKLGFDFINGQAGQIRNIPVSLTNSAHQPPDSNEVLILLEDLCDFVNDNFRNLPSSYLSAYFLWRILWIHPFVEGNGSLGRLISYAIIQIGYGFVLPGQKTLPVLLSENRSDYYEALFDADKRLLSGGIDVTRLEDLIVRLLDKQMTKI